MPAVTIHYSTHTPALLGDEAVLFLLVVSRGRLRSSRVGRLRSSRVVVGGCTTKIHISAHQLKMTLVETKSLRERKIETMRTIVNTTSGANK